MRGGGWSIPRADTRRLDRPDSDLLGVPNSVVMAVLDTVASAQRAIHVDAPRAMGSSPGTTSVLLEACPLIERRDIENVEVRVC